VNQDLLARLGWYVAERQAVWERRNAGLPRPWTDDEVLRTNHFTNVYRELDPGTIFAQRVMQLLSRQDRVWFAVAYRLINRRQTFEEYRGSFGVEHTEEWLDYINDRYARGVTTKTSRHLTPRRALYEKGVRTVGKVDLPRNAHAAWDTLGKLPGVGTFCGWQVFCDLVQVGEVDDDQSFVIVGDGAAYALYTLYGQRNFEDYWHDGRAGANIGRDRKIGGRVRVQSREHREWSIRVIRWLVAQQHQWLRSDFVWWRDNPLDNKNVEHSLCEWLRYERLKIKCTPR
jgi:hypothetical protein